MSIDREPGTARRYQQRRDIRLVPIAAAAWSAAAVVIQQPAASSVIVVAAAVATVGTLAFAAAFRSRLSPWARTALSLLAVTFAACGAVALQTLLAQPARAAAVMIVAEARGAPVSAVVAVVGKIEQTGEGWRADALLRSFSAGRGAQVEAAEAVSGAPVLLRVARGSGESETDIDLGVQLRVSGTAWPASAGSRAVLVIDVAAQPEVLEGASGVWAVASALRRGLLATTSGLPAPGAGLIAGIAVGDTSAVSGELDADMKTSSLSHLTAVSGANCALVVGLAFGIAAVCRATLRVRVLAGLGALASFVVLVSPEPSVVRAAAMAAIAMLGLLLGRPGAGLSLLALAIIVLLIFDPWLALSIGFALSSAATAALLLLAGPLADGMARWMPRPLALTLAVPLAAQLACGPLIVLIAPQFSPYGVIANVLAAPAAPLGTVLGLAACFLAGVPWLGGGFAALAWLPAAWISGVATSFADMPGAVIAWPEGAVGFVALAVVGSVVAVVITPVAPRWHARAVFVLAALVGAAIALGPVSQLIARATSPAGWTVAACDVGQGDAVLVRSRAAVALIDTGPDPGLLERCLDQLGVARINLLVLTHFDLDHRGGIAAVHGRVDVVMHGPGAVSAGADALDMMREGGARLIEARRGMSGPLGDAHWRVLWPRAETPPGNDASVIIDVAGEEVPTSLFLGDLSEEGQQAMSAGAELRDHYDVVKVAHHGSADQSAALYRRVRAAVALVTVGENDYGHPRSETLALLEGMSSRIARTDEEGVVAVWRDGTGLRLWHERAPSSVGVGG